MARELMVGNTYLDDKGRGRGAFATFKDAMHTYLHPRDPHPLHMPACPAHIAMSYRRTGEAKTCIRFCEYICTWPHAPRLRGDAQVTKYYVVYLMDGAPSR